MTTDQRISALGAPSYSLEIEVKFDVDAAHEVPDLSSLPGVATVDAAEERPLDAVYFDTEDMVLSRRGTALRRRTGGPDAGWHLKVSAPEGKHEYGWPLGEELDDPLDARVPEGIRSALEDTIAPGTPLAPLARLRNRRMATVLRDAAGGVVAEFTDDTVHGEDLRRGGASSWREWEFELGPAAPSDREGIDRLFHEVTAAVERAGGRPASSGSKLRRTLRESAKA